MNYSKHETSLIGKKAHIGEGTKIWAFTNIQDGAVVGRFCKICDHCFIENGALLGDHVTLKNSVCIFEGITLEDDVFCGANTAFINDRFPRSNRKEPWILEKTLIKHGATLGSNTTVLCGITIGRYAFIGAGSVVTKNVPDYTIVIGNPAKFAGYACRCGHKLSDALQCPCGLQYVLDQGNVSLKSQ